MLSDYLIRCSSKYSELIHPKLNLSGLQMDMNYLVYSMDEYMNYIVVNEMIEKFIGQKYINPTMKEVDNVIFKTFHNVVDINCEAIQRKYRNNIHAFVAKYIRRQPINYDKHLIILRNYNGIMRKFQEQYKSTIERSFTNTCFIVTTNDVSAIHNHIKHLLSFIRIPLLKDKEVLELLSRVASDNDIDDVDVNSVIKNCDMDLYTCLCDIQKIHDSCESKSTFINLFEKAIADLLDFMKKSKSLEKTIETMRITMNKLLYYSLSDNWLCNTILKRTLEIKKIKKYSHEIVEEVTKCNYDLINNGKKIFAYERLLIAIYGFMHSI